MPAAGALLEVGCGTGHFGARSAAVGSPSSGSIARRRCSRSYAAGTRGFPWSSATLTRSRSVTPRWTSRCSSHAGVPRGSRHGCPGGAPCLAPRGRPAGLESMEPRRRVLARGTGSTRRLARPGAGCVDPVAAGADPNGRRPSAHRIPVGKRAPARRPMGLAGGGPARRCQRDRRAAHAAPGDERVSLRGAGAPGSWANLTTSTNVAATGRRRARPVPPGAQYDPGAPREVARSEANRKTRAAARMLTARLFERGALSGWGAGESGDSGWRDGGRVPQGAVR